MTSLRFLIVEKDKMVAAGLGEAVAQLGYEVAGIVASSAEAVAASERIRPHVVLMDVRQDGPPDAIRAADQISESVGSQTLFLVEDAGDPIIQRLNYTQPLSYLVLPVDPDLLRAACQIAFFRRLTEGALGRARSQTEDGAPPEAPQRAAEDMEETLNARARQQRMVSQLGQLALSGVSLTTLLAETADAVAQTLEVEFCKVLEYRPDRNDLLLKMGVGWKAGLIGEAAVDVIEGSLEAHLLHSSEPVLVEDFGRDTRFKPSALLRAHGAVNALCVVIRCITGPYGILSAHSTRIRTFTGDDISFLDSVANVLALAIEQKRAEQALQESQRRYELAVAGAGEGLWEWSLEANQVYVSSEGTALLGQGGAPAYYWPEQCGQFIHPDDRPRVREALEQHLEGETPYFGAEFRAGPRDTERRWLYARGIAIRDRKGGVQRVCGTFRDTSARRERFVHEIMEPLKQLAEEQAGDELRGTPFSPKDELSAVGAYIRSLMREVTETRTSLAERQSQLQMTEKLASVGQLAASVAHEIRNPLTSLRMRLYSLESSFGNDPDYEEDFLVISDEINRLQAIVQHFLEFARPRELDLRVADVREVIEESLEVLRPQLEEGNIRLVREEEPGIPEVRIDSGQIEQVLINLLANAIDALEDGGQLTISVTLEEAPPAREQVCILITDSGPGITEEVQSRLFEPFFTTKEKGTGLGLCISSQIMERHGGRLSVRKTGPGGTTFAVCLPVG